MADYFCPTVFHQLVPVEDMTPLERLILTHVFRAEAQGDGLYFFADEGPLDVITLSRTELDIALGASKNFADSRAVGYVSERLSGIPAEETVIDLDLSGTSWEFFVQDIVRRSSTLRHVSVVASFTCTKMRPEGFGGMATLITADAIRGKSTTDLLEEFLAEAGLEV